MKTGGDIFTTADGRPRVLVGVQVLSAAPELAELAVRMGFDAVWIEMEHAATGFAEAEHLCQAVEAGGGIPVIRVADGQRGHVLRALEVGARIVVVPMINTAEQAGQVVRHGKFPPLGARGFNRSSRGLGYGLHDLEETFARANEQTHLFTQVETVEAVKNLEEICALDGLSGVFIGPGDLSMDLGCPGKMDDPRLLECVTDCVRRARRMGKRAGILTSPGPLLEAALAAGGQLCFCGSDYGAIRPAWRELRRAVGPTE